MNYAYIISSSSFKYKLIIIMGSVALKLVSKTGKDKLTSAYSSLHEIGAVDIDGNNIDRLGNILQGKRCIMVVNVASKWGLTDVQYT